MPSTHAVCSPRIVRSGLFYGILFLEETQQELVLRVASIFLDLPDSRPDLTYVPPSQWKTVQELRQVQYIILIVYIHAVQVYQQYYNGELLWSVLHRIASLPLCSSLDGETLFQLAVSYMVGGS